MTLRKAASCTNCVVLAELEDSTPYVCEPDHAHAVLTASIELILDGFAAAI